MTRISNKDMKITFSKQDKVIKNTYELYEQKYIK